MAGVFGEGEYKDVEEGVYWLAGEAEGVFIEPVWLEVCVGDCVGAVEFV